MCYSTRATVFISTLNGRSFMTYLITLTTLTGFQVAAEVVAQSLQDAEALARPDMYVGDTLTVEVLHS